MRQVTEWYWDVNLLDFVRAQQPVISTDVLNVTISDPLAVTGPLTDTQLRATAIPVSGTFFQATQPVSVASMPSTPVTGTFWQATQPVSGTFWQTTQPVSLATAPTTPVTGTFWQSTQPVSIASMPSTPVTGTFWQATQPVSGTVTANPATYAGKTITFVSIAQGAAGTTVLAAADGTKKHKVLGMALTLDATGTAKLNDGTVDLTGAMDFSATGGIVLPNSIIPYTETAAVNRALNLITTSGKAKGFVVILTEA